MYRNEELATLMPDSFLKEEKITKRLFYRLYVTENFKVEVYFDLRKDSLFDVFVRPLNEYACSLDHIDIENFDLKIYEVNILLFKTFYG